MVIYSSSNALFVNYCVVGLLKIYFRYSEFKSCYAIIIQYFKINPLWLLRTIHIYNINDVSFVFTSSWLQEGSCLIYVISAYLRIVVTSTYSVVFLFCFLRLAYPMLSVYLDYPFLIAPSVFSNLYLMSQHLGLTPVFVGFFQGAALLNFSFPYCVFFCMSEFCVLLPMLLAPLDCPYFTTPSVFSKFCFAFYSKAQLEEKDKNRRKQN